ncbi:MAG: phosphate ABC transporter substrate-binding protein [Proteobacteria bacterium]|nr:phosphate ABC transporter substrate-binding protein [Pseudomonadota bacterium]
MKKSVLFTFAILLLSLASAVQGAEIKWAGCGVSKKAFMKELAASYEKKTGTKVSLKGSGATKGIRLVAAGEFDIGGSCRHKLDVLAEKEAMLHHVAWDALVIIVKKDNPVDSMTTEQVKAVFKGTIKNWKELGGPAAPVKLLVRKGKTSGAGLMLREILFNNPDEDYSPDAELKKSSGPIEAGVSKDINAIGVTGVSSAKKRKKVKMLKVDGVAPSKEAVMSGKYPFVRPLYIVTRGEPTGEIKKFIDFAKSPEGQAIISSQGTVNLEEGKSLKVR